MDLETRLERAQRGSAETLTTEELRRLLERDDHPRAYIGFEPSGRLTIGHLVTAGKMADLAAAGFRLTVFLADWHAWINEKLGGDLLRIRAAGELMRAVFTSLGLDPARVEYRWASELQAQDGYWARVVRVAKATSLARTKRAMTILGRAEAETELDTAKLLYPAMQVADIFELPVDLAYAGVDQRRAHVLAREVAHHYDWPVPVALHTPLISSLQGGARMDPVAAEGERKMSKSDPESAIYLPSSREEIATRIAKAYCPAREVDGNPVVEIARFIVLPRAGRLDIPRSEKHGGPVTFEGESPFLEEWRAGRLHPMDLKAGVTGALDRIIEPVRSYFASHPEVAATVP